MLLYVLKKASDLAAARWDGGTTTELFLYPPGASYAGRDFALRVSSATVELERSRFTSLPGYRRHIMPLAGTMELAHDGHHTAQLAPYEVDVFEGAWQTDCAGTCTDFNLMCGEGWQGELYAIPRTDKITCERDGFVGVYAPAGSLQLICTGEESCKYAAALDKGDFFLVQCSGQEGPAVEIYGASPAHPAVILAVGPPLSGNGGHAKTFDCN